MASVSEKRYQFLYLVSQRQRPHQATQHLSSQIIRCVVGSFNVLRADYVFDEALRDFCDTNDS